MTSLIASALVAGLLAASPATLALLPPASGDIFVTGAAAAAATSAYGAPVASKAPSFSSTEERSDLLVPTEGQSHAAFRYDTEVFGWSRDFSEVGAVCMEVVRGAKGRHRGEAYMLVYRLGEWLPKHNIICHNITHVDLPHNPVPMEQAKDYLWVIENSYLNMWPRRPMRRPRRGFMQVQPVVAFLPAALKLPIPDVATPPELPKDTPDLVRASRAEEDQKDQEALAAARARPLAERAFASVKGEEARCRPWVGFVLRYRGQVRLQPFVPLDMDADCQLLTRDDAPRTYWGRRDVAASMVRVNFARNPANEESARFVTSAAWRLAARPTLTLAAPLPAAKSHALARAVQAAGGRFVRAKPLRARGGGILQARGGRGWLPWAAYLGEHHGLAIAHYQVDEAVQGVRLELADVAPLPPAAQPGQTDQVDRAKNSGAANGAADDAAGATAPFAVPSAPQAPKAPALPSIEVLGDGVGTRTPGLLPLPQPLRPPPPKAFPTAPGDPVAPATPNAPTAPVAPSRPAPPSPSPEPPSTYLEDWHL